MDQNYDDLEEPLDHGAESMTKIDFWTACSSNGIILDIEQMEHLTRYHDELWYWNEKVNMISRKDVLNIWERHILHALTLVKYGVFPPKARVLDVGTGGGLPGIPLKIARPDLRVLLMDSIRKKIVCTEMFAQHTGLKDIEARCGRVEDLVKESNYRRGFDVIVSRAVGRTAVLLDWVRPLMKQPGGVCYFLKGGDLREEFAEARERHPGLQITETPIDLFGVPSFKTDEKKIITCSYAL